MWRDVYPIGVHFAAAQLIGSVFLGILTYLYTDPTEMYYRWVMELSGIAGAAAMLFMLYFYRKDKAAREYGRLIPSPGGSKLPLQEAFWFLAIGAGLAIYGNMLVSCLTVFFSPETYSQEMDMVTQGKSMGEMILWMGIISPLAEEVIFRWCIYLRLRDSMQMKAAMIISGVLFGIYHGNLLQGIYAAILGSFFAWFLEMSGNLWSCVLLHIGANVMSLLISEYGAWLGTYMGGILLLVYVALLAAIVFGVMHFFRKGRERGYRAI